MRNLEQRLAIFCLVAGILLLFLAAGLFIGEQQMSSGIGYSLIAGLALLICYAVLSPRALADLVRSRQSRFGSLSVVVSAAVIGLLVMANVIASRSVASADLTRGGLYTLSPKSELVVRRLDSDLLVTGFFRPGTDDSDRRAAQALLAEYRKQSPHVHVQFVNPDTSQDLVLRTGVKINGALAVGYRGKTPIVLNLGSQTESDITSAILKLESERTPTICWGSGEGERNLQSAAVDGYTQANDQLAGDNFKVASLVLGQIQAIPASCDIVAVVGLQRPITDAAQAALTAYLAQGGRMLITADPWTADPKSGQDPVLASVNALLKGYGVQFDGGLVIDPDPAHSASNDPTSPVVFDYGQSPITTGLANKLTFFPQPTGVTLRTPDQVTDSQIARTTKDSYEIPKARESIARTGQDRAGPFTIMGSVEQSLGGTDAGGQKKRVRVVAVGTSSFAENRTMPPNAPGFNSQLLLGSFDWLAGNDQLIALAPKPASKYPLPLTDQDFAVNVVVSSILVPAVMILIGIGVWLARRRSYTPPA